MRAARYNPSMGNRRTRFAIHIGWAIAVAIAIELTMMIHAVFLGQARMPVWLHLALILHTTVLAVLIQKRRRGLRYAELIRDRNAA